MQKEYITQNISGENPDWYWQKSGGLHDAKIILSEQDSDIESTSQYNCFKIFIELVDKQCIKFYNYKILNDCNLNGKWWLCDTLDFKNGKYIINITVCDSYGKEELFTIRFTDAEFQKAKEISVLDS